MIRANLLPRKRQTFSAFSREIDIDTLREIGMALAIVAVVTLIGIQIGRFRLERLNGAISIGEEALLARRSGREESRRLMLEVARYQEFEREAYEYRNSGTLAALDVARIGNSLPQRLWVDGIVPTDDSFSISGGSHSISSVAIAIAALSHALPKYRATFDSVDRQGVAAPEGTVRFAIRIAPQSPSNGIGSQANAAKGLAR